MRRARNGGRERGHSGSGHPATTIQAARRLNDDTPTRGSRSPGYITRAGRARRSAERRRGRRSCPAATGAEAAPRRITARQKRPLAALHGHVFAKTRFSETPSGVPQGLERPPGIFSLKPVFAKGGRLGALELRPSAALDMPWRAQGAHERRNAGGPCYDLQNVAAAEARRTFETASIATKPRGL